NTENGARGGRDRRFHLFGIEIEGVRLDIDKHRNCPAVADAVSGRDEGMADGNYFVTGPNAGGPQRQVQRRSAVGYRARILCAHTVCKLAFKSNYFRPLRNPPGKNNPPGCFGFTLIDTGLCNGYQSISFCQDKLRKHRPGDQRSCFCATTQPAAQALLRAKLAPRSRASAPLCGYRRAAAKPDLLFEQVRIPPANSRPSHDPMQPQAHSNWSRLHWRR